MRAGAVGRKSPISTILIERVTNVTRYRNFLMLCTGLFEQQIQPLYFPLLDASPPPSVRNLQSWVKSAWDNGKTPLSCLQ